MCFRSISCPRSKGRARPSLSHSVGASTLSWLQQLANLKLPPNVFAVCMSFKIPSCLATRLRWSTHWYLSLAQKKSKYVSALPPSKNTLMSKLAMYFVCVFAALPVVFLSVFLPSLCLVNHHLEVLGSNPVNFFYVQLLPAIRFSLSRRIKTQVGNNLTSRIWLELFSDGAKHELPRSAVTTGKKIYNLQCLWRKRTNIAFGLHLESKKLRKKRVTFTMEEHCEVPCDH